MEQRQELFHTMNIMVASVLMTYGFKLITYTHILRSDGKESKEFWFNNKSSDCDMSAADAANYLTKEVEKLKAKNPEHPLLWMRGALLNRGEIVGIVKKTPRMIQIRNGDRSALIAENASEETKRQIAELL